MRIRNKNGLDLWRISDIFLNGGKNSTGGVQNSIVEAAKKKGLGFRTMVHAVVESELFHLP